MPMFVRRIKDELYTPDNKEFVPSDKRERAYDIHRYGFSCNADVATNPCATRHTALRSPLDRRYRCSASDRSFASLIPPARALA